jgi:hypothetical protein
METVTSTAETELAKEKNQRRGRAKHVAARKEEPSASGWQRTLYPAEKSKCITIYSNQLLTSAVES